MCKGRGREWKGEEDMNREKGREREKRGEKWKEREGDVGIDHFIHCITLK